MWRRGRDWFIGLEGEWFIFVSGIIGGKEGFW